MELALLTWTSKNKCINPNVHVKKWWCQKWCPVVNSNNTFQFLCNRCYINMVNYEILMPQNSDLKLYKSQHWRNINSKQKLHTTYLQLHIKKKFIAIKHKAIAVAQTCKPQWKICITSNLTQNDRITDLTLHLHITDRKLYLHFTDLTLYLHITNRKLHLHITDLTLSPHHRHKTVSPH